jgi:hypothetical protein
LIPPYTVIEGDLEVLAKKNDKGIQIPCHYKTHKTARLVCFLLNGYNANAGWEIYRCKQPFLVVRKLSKTAYSYHNQANAERLAGGSCYVNPLLPEVSITASTGIDWRFQKTKAQKLLIEARRTLRETGLTDHLSIEDYLLVSFRNHAKAP